MGKIINERGDSMIRQHQKTLNILHVLADFLLVTGSLAISFVIAGMWGYGVPKPYRSFWVEAGICVLAGGLHLAAYGILGLYRSHRNIPFWIQATELARANLAAYVVLAAGLYFLDAFAVAQVAITLFFFLCTGLQLLYRWILHKVLVELRKKGFNKKFLLILGHNDCTRPFVEKIRQSPGFGYEVTGFLNDEPVERAVIPWLGKRRELERYLRENVVDEVFIMLRQEEQSMLGKETALLEKYGVKFSILPQLFASLPSRIYVSSFDGMPVLGMRKIPLDSLWAAFCKRTFDILGALAALLLFSPILLAAAAAVRISSPGPVIFRQVRVGMDRRPFQMYKLRSMRVETEHQVRMACPGDDRCTPVGAFLRKYSIDELPQLFNVLKGDMSLVGPRPEIPHFVSEFREEIPQYMLKHYVRPGMTGLAQIHGLRGGDTSIEERIRYDMKYIENWSLGLDVEILFRTIGNLRSDRKPKKEGRH